jgi:P2 family phage contractile tail tube protein
MAEKININRLTNANIYLDGVSLLGKAEEVSSPTITFKMTEHKAMGMYGAMEFPSGIDKMEMKIKWNSLYPEVMKKAAGPFKNHQLQVRGSLEQWNAIEGRKSEVPVVIFITGAFKNFPTGTFKQHDNVELETMLTVYAIKEEIDGEEIVEVDVMSNIFKVNGEDQFAKFRANLGA